MASTTLLFSPLPSTAFFHKNPNSSNSFLLCNFSPLSVSISINNTSTSTSSRRSTSYVSPSAAAISFTNSIETSASSSTNGDPLDIAELGISQEIVSALSRRGITHLFPIQRAVLEPAMQGRDMIGRAITGSGKTLAFGIPILDNILRNRVPRRQRRAPSALVLAPTRELARQVQKEFKDSAPNLGSACLYGGTPIMNQVRTLAYGIDIAVGTPGRIIDLVERGALNLSEVKFVVLDEADQMLAIGFQEDVERILSYLPAKRQCMLFSATMPPWVNELSKKYLTNPLVVDLVGDSEQKLADGISLYSVVSTSYGKENILPSLISEYGQGGKSIIFTRTKKDAEELSRSMGSILASKALHGNMQQFQRDRTLNAFRDGRFNVLVATDVAARGLDIPNVDLVIHFEIPNTSEIFVHRSGRTGRAGKKGTAILMYTKAQRRSVTTIERDLGCKFKELPSIAGSSGSRMGRTDVDDRSYGRYDDSGPSRRQYPSRSGPLGERNFGSYAGSRGNSYESRTRQPRDYRLPEERFGGYGDATRTRQSRDFRQPEERFGNYGNESRTRQSRDFRQPEESFGGYGRSRNDNYSRFSDSKSVPFSKSRESQLKKYNDFDDDQNSENKSKSRQEGFKQILDMLREQT